jgi:dihydrofolate reductase
MTVTVISSVTLDGVVQAPARPDEDTRGGFTHGGWAVPYGDDEAATAAWGEVIARATGGGGGFLLGRRTYLDFIEAWPKRRPDHRYTATLTKTPKYVASTTLTEPLPWENSVLLTDPVQQVPGLKREKDLVIMGSGALIQSLSRAGLIDEYLLTITPLVLGEGRRLFPVGFPYTKLTLTSAKPSTTGVDHRHLSDGAAMTWQACPSRADGAVARANSQTFLLRGQLHRSPLRDRIPHSWPTRVRAPARRNPTFYCLSRRDSPTTGVQSCSHACTRLKD